MRTAPRSAIFPIPTAPEHDHPPAAAGRFLQQSPEQAQLLVAADQFLPVPSPRAADANEEQSTEIRCPDWEPLGAVLPCRHSAVHSHPVVLADLLRDRRAKRGSCLRRLAPGRQALLVPTHLRGGHTYAWLASGFGIVTITAWRVGARNSANAADLRFDARAFTVHDRCSWRCNCSI